MLLEKRSEARSLVESSARKAVRIFGTLSQGRWARRPGRGAWDLFPFSISFLLWRFAEIFAYFWVGVQKHLAHSRKEDGRVDLVEELGTYFRFQFHFCSGVLQRYSHTFG